MTRAPGQLRRTRVAIIDSGVDQGEFATAAELTGATFSETHSDSLWWLSPERHGTQMAKIITAIDPCCQLFIAKVGDHRSDIAGGAVEKAVEWADKEQHADVISMSFALDLEDAQHADLLRIVQNAAHEGIVMVCSTADDGDNKLDAWPASYPSTIAIATAMAAGVASLCLSCYQLDNGVPVPGPERANKVKEYFSAMTGGQNKKYVMPWLLFGDGRKDACDKFLSK
ncbi:peptidase S8/S53 domain-containing protein [Lasiosphaeria ovina]|uniref:Peptidase S8/S53 domain-containing protein n=1 Tax=Lasiosphaeria ovina TaxID=92902 RepID=A0AAE0N265_9PEZI|nr:peptidase S8/S53 domain-containing protein [Lasiosphaeria ovina]